MFQSTKSIYRIRDDSGTIEVMQWKDENAQSNDHLDEGETVRIVGSVRCVTIVFTTLCQCYKCLV